jgi:hypothetical protein
VTATVSQEVIEEKSHVEDERIKTENLHFLL